MGKSAIKTASIGTYYGNKISDYLKQPAVELCLFVF